MNVQKGITNPFTGVSVGSTVLGNNFSPSIINSNITKIVTQKEIEKYMTGQSQYVYSDKLNEGTLGVSGSYGISGVAKFTSSLSTYVGNATASSSKSINVDYNISMISGIEYINFDDLTAEDILNSLSRGPKNLALKVLDKFNAVKQYLKQRETVNNINYQQSDSIKEDLMKDWLKSLQEFSSAYGDGLVVGVIWGGLGTVSMKMSSSSYENNWKYGENAEFAYSGIGTTVSVKQSYNGGQTDANSTVSADCSAWISGGCVEEQVNKWFDVVSGKAFNEIADIQLLDRAPTVSSVSAPPTIPDFIRPTEDKETKDKLEKIGQLGETEEFSVASGYEEAKKTNSSLTLEKFKEYAKQKNKLEALEQLSETLKNNRLDVFSNENYHGKIVQLSPKSTVKSASSISKSTSTDHAVLGVWILNWSDIFPWMSMGYINEISDTASAEVLLRMRCMLQDLAALSNIYYTLDSCKLNLEDFHLSSASQLADSFSSALAKLKDMLDRDDAIQKTFDSLSTEAQAIYKKWNELKFLRNAELGLGLLINGKRSVTTEIDRVKPYPYPEAIYKTDNCTYGGHNYSAFSSFMKVLPMLDSNGDIYAFGPSSMLLKNTLNNEVTFTKGGITAMKFQPDMNNETLVNGDSVLIPIPYSAATNIRWNGQGMGKSLASSTSVHQQIEELQKELGELNMCSFSSENWSPDWKYTDAYQLRKLKTAYLGLVDRIGNIFN
ncbi:hypothetical protein Xsto_01703 [Xenorhabdus stockiae]|uniref:Uncharacterized protein n=1 Tax=Xenorhabdus stockiae TaxID=351614 RepID=A0A2D0KQV6_9GAMM|nr:MULTISPECIES: hypothetical protein [Xenorhabdus]PHM65758.1 hypothetical protein Xsto_01703 [Xenorhabdus stockiae]PHM68428.1 hypothetical protein Xekj_03371 [Xenorhabdus sp. KJ12.1]